MEHTEETEEAGTGEASSVVTSIISRLTDEEIEKRAWRFSAIINNRHLLKLEKHVLLNYSRQAWAYQQLCMGRSIK